MNLIRYQHPELSTWSPFNRLASLRSDLDRLFDLSNGGETGWVPPLDVHDDKDHFVVTVEVPGMKKEDIGISLHDGVLSISGERKDERVLSEGATYRKERFFGKFERHITLPVGVDAAKVTAGYKDGVLTVTLPKAEEAKPKKIAVSVS